VIDRQYASAGMGARRFRSVQTILLAHKKAHQAFDLGCFAMTYGVVRAFQVIVNTF
jgi:hypothetical protein